MRAHTFRAACEYKIVVDKVAEEPLPYPLCHEGNWGPSWAHMHHYGLWPAQEAGLIELSHTDPLIKINNKEPTPRYAGTPQAIGGDRFVAQR